MGKQNKRMRTLLNSEVDKYAKDRELFFTAFRESKAMEIIKMCMNAELSDQFIPKLDLKRFKWEDSTQYESRVQNSKNELEIWKAKMQYRAFTFMLDKIIQLFPKVPQETVKEKHSQTLRAIIKDAHDRYIPKDSSQATLELIEKTMIEHEFSSIDEPIEELTENKDKDLEEEG